MQTAHTRKSIGLRAAEHRQKSGKQINRETTLVQRGRRNNVQWPRYVSSCVIDSSRPTITYFYTTGYGRLNLLTPLLSYRYGTRPTNSYQKLSQKKSAERDSSGSDQRPSASAPGVKSQERQRPAGEFLAQSSPGMKHSCPPSLSSVSAKYDRPGQDCEAAAAPGRIQTNPPFSSFDPGRGE